MEINCDFSLMFLRMEVKHGVLKKAEERRVRTAHETN